VVIARQAFPASITGALGDVVGTVAAAQPFVSVIDATLGEVTADIRADVVYEGAVPDGRQAR
jgi:hypothetical protein